MPWREIEEQGHVVGLALQECVPQVRAVLNAVSDAADLTFAHEPIWAIGAQESARTFCVALRMVSKTCMAWCEKPTSKQLFRLQQL